MYWCLVNETVGKAEIGRNDVSGPTYVQTEITSHVANRLTMLTNVCLTHLRTLGQCLRHQARRNLGVSAVLAQKADDPIQKLFVEKLREYAQKKKAAGGKLVDATPEVMGEFDFEMNRLQAQYKVEDEDMSKFPTLSFRDKSLEVAAPASTDRDVKDLPL